MDLEGGEETGGGSGGQVGRSREGGMEDVAMCPPLIWWVLFFISSSRRFDLFFQDNAWCFFRIIMRGGVLGWAGFRAFSASFLFFPWENSEVRACVFFFRC